MFTVKSFSFYGFMLLMLSQYSFSQIILQGTVTDNGGEYLGNGAEPMQGLLVTLTDQTDTNRIFSTYTDKQGYYSLEITQTSVGDDAVVTPLFFRLLQNYPNPFNPSTVIVYELSQPAHISIEIYNVLGKKVKTLVDCFKNTSGQVIWDGTNDIGQGVSSGLYIYSLNVEGKRVNRKMLLTDGTQGIINNSLDFSFRPNNTGFLGLEKQASNQYILTVTGNNIAVYEQDLEIISSMTVDVTVIRTVTDIDGNIYQTVKIGNQWWMVKNLKVTRYRNGDVIPNVTDGSTWVSLSTGAYCAYGNDEDVIDMVGYLYNWYAVDDSRNIAPWGWHVPSDAEWTILTDYLGGTSIAGGKLKATEPSWWWMTPNTGATNESGFSALPGGCRNDINGWDDQLGISSFFWTSLDIDQNAWSRFILYNSAEIYCSSGYGKQYGFSVRLVRD